MITNVLGTPLRACCMDPPTGFFRDGFCRTGRGDVGIHTVCAKMTQEFLEFSMLRGNDLSTPRPEYGFKGLQDGDMWCLSVERWVEAFDAGIAPSIELEACHLSVLEYVDLEVLNAYGI
ncbi:DUF2237 family protein [Luteolibacter algae]|uniref:DUF2237 family protein n=1 Tax=Luteolibacter algae TaxID=454151 RepID=A0ABW5DBV9_9BACT